MEMKTLNITFDEYQKDFCALILTHGRPNNVKTLRALQKSGYTGDYFIVIDNEDKTADEYRKRFGDHVVMFDKPEIANTFDNGDNFNDRRAIIYARNASFDIAKEKGYKYFIQLDDDYDGFYYKFDDQYNYNRKRIKNLDKIFFYMLKHYLSVPALSIAMAQMGDFIGGENSALSRRLYLKRKAMNTFICSVDRPFKFVGRINEDVNTYTKYGSMGHLFYTIPLLAINQAQTQSSSGGMTDIYLNSGTYVKSFYTVMYMPSSVKIREMGNINKRLHHNISWRNTVPCILRENKNLLNI